MELVRNKEKLIITAETEYEAKTAELLLKPILQGMSLRKAAGDAAADWDEFKALTKGMNYVSDAEIESLANEVDEALFDNFKNRH